MSMFGGTAVFCVLGFMAKQVRRNFLGPNLAQNFSNFKLGLSIHEVVQSGTGLAFIAYPEVW